MRRWEPPVHPTKDLILYDSDGNAIENTSSSDNLSPRFAPTATKPQPDYTPTHVRLEEEKKRRMSQGVSSYRNSDSPPSSPSEPDDSDMDLERSAGALSWSVSKLKSLYDNSSSSSASSGSRAAEERPVPKPRNAAARPSSQAQQTNAQSWRQKSCVIITKEQTNPNAEKQYL